MEGKKVLLVDTDPQGSLTIALGHPRPDDLPVTLTDLLQKVIEDQPIAPREGILAHEESVDLVPASITLSGLEVSLVNAMSTGKLPVCQRPGAASADREQGQEADQSEAPCGRNPSYDGRRPDKLFQGNQPAHPGNLRRKAACL